MYTLSGSSQGMQIEPVDRLRFGVRLNTAATSSGSPYGGNRDIDRHMGISKLGPDVIWVHSDDS